ncbi:MAG TPA: molecular chaperone DnaK, partial [Syntrophobacteraceae bacterium]|nr:molecular chaperone DnaK [Syntrophobacteraceae bacterium]
HADEDKKKRELIETRNHADSLIYSTEKTLREMGDKIDGTTRQSIETAIEKLRKTMEGEDAAAMKTDMDQLMQASHKLAEEMYKRSAEQQAAGAHAEGAEQQGGTHRKPDDDVVDADFEEVKDK